MQVSIGETDDKTAANLARTDFIDDSYHNSIKQAGQELVDLGLSHYLYQTQWSSGRTIWKGSEDEPIATVSSRGQVSLAE